MQTSYNSFYDYVKDHKNALICRHPKRTKVSRFSDILPLRVKVIEIFFSGIFLALARKDCYSLARQGLLKQTNN